jgi:methyl-accepting chemotaxis protein
MRVISRFIHRKLLVLGLATSLLPLGIATWMAARGQAGASDEARRACLELGHRQLAQMAQCTYVNCKGQQEVLQQIAASGLEVTKAALQRAGGLRVDPSKQVSWTAVNQVDQSRSEPSLPRLMAGDTWLGQVRESSRIAPIVDEVQSQVGGTATIFQRINAQGDMLRVCTNIRKKDGTRAVGTYIPAKEPSGKATPVVAELLAGRSYRGRAYVVDRWYITIYEPVLDAAGAVIGALYFGHAMESATSLRDAISSMRLGKSGYVFVLDSQGRYVISKDGKRDGESLWDAEDADGNHMIRAMVSAARSSKPHEPAVVRYAWRNSPSEEPRDKLAHLVYFEPWDWVIGVSAYAEEFEESGQAIAEKGHEATMMLLGLVLIVAFVATLLTVIVSRRMTLPLKRAAVVADRVAQGELSERVGHRSQDEVGRLGSAIDEMCGVLQRQAQVAREIADGDLTVQPHVAGPGDEFGNAVLGMVTRLRELVADVQQAATRMRTGTQEISGASLALSEGATRQAASLEEIGSSVAELSAQASQTAEGARSADKNSTEATQRTLAGQEQMSELTAAMSGISESSQKISSIIQVIDDIAFQTNLLALNAAVEAARAGRHGKGFAVVAEEVRALAARSARAAHETAQLIEASLEQVKTGEEITGTTSESLVEIAARAQETSELVSEITRANEDGARGLSEIRDALSQIDAVTQQNAASSEETSAAVQALDSQADSLQQLLSKFRV